MDTVTGVWIAASKVLGRAVPADEPYPHICGRRVTGDQTMSGKPTRVGSKDCAACGGGS